MSQTISAIYENGVIRPLQQVALNNGDEIEVLVIDRRPDPQEAYRILHEISALPDDGPVDGFSGGDHDSVLYPSQK